MARAATFPRLLSLLGAALALGACSSSWSVQTARAPWALQWPFAPGPAKLTYVGALTGFTKKANAGETVASFVAGIEKKDADAFVLPVAVATAPDGRIAVADMGRACVHLFLPAEKRYLRLTGTKEEPMLSPVAVAFDPAGTLFASDSAGRVYAYSPAGAPLYTIHAAGPAPLERPTGLAWAPRLGVLYVVDTLAHAIHAFDAKGVLVFTIGGRGTEGGRFNFPTHLAVTRTGELLVTDSLNFRVQILDEKGKFLGAFGHQGDGSGDFARPKGIAADADGVIYVADSLFDVVQLFDRDGRFLLALGSRGVDFGEFWMPAGIFVDEKSELYVCDTYNHRVQVFRITEGYADAIH
jgi:DNA-binding beta-propeller fold protein YncE